MGIAVFHSIFNIVNTILLFPFSKQLEKLARFIIRDSDEEQEMILDERLMLTPTIAVGESANFVTKMFTKVRGGLDKATAMLMTGYNSDDHFLTHILFSSLNCFLKVLLGILLW